MTRKIKFTAIWLLLLCFTVSVLPIKAHAGASKVTIDDSSFAEKLDNTVWNNPNGDVVPTEGKLVFAPESTEETRLISKTAVSKSDLTENMFHGSMVIHALDIPEGQSFIFALGLRGIESMPGEKGNVEIVLTNQGGLKVCVQVYETADTPTVIVQPQSVGNQKIALDVELTTDQKFKVKANGKLLYNDVLPVSGEGRIGFLQTGSCHVEVSDIRLSSYSYATPENANVFENFDNGTMDTSLLGSAMIKDFGYYPCRISVDDYNGNQMMVFKNSGLGYIGTKHQYSNFELTFDVPYLQREEIYAEDYTLQMPKSGWFGISFGDEYMDASWYDYDYKSPYMVYFSEWSSIIDFKNNFKVLADLSNSDHAFFAEGETRGFSVRFAVVDAKVEIGIKWMDEEEFTTVSAYDIANGQTPTGYIHIWGSEPNNFAIDNIKITNLDVNPVLVETEYKAGTVIVPEDYDYQRAEMVFKESVAENIAEEQPVGWNLLIFGSAGGAIIMVVVSVLIAIRRKRKAVA